MEVDVCCNSNKLQNLVRAVVTLSSSRAALGLALDMPELRADIFEIEDYTDEEANQYMH